MNFSFGLSVLGVFCCIKCMVCLVAPPEGGFVQREYSVDGKCF